jgi:hypothetical protein
MSLRGLALGTCFGIAATLAALPTHADDPAPAILSVDVSPQPVIGGQQATTTVCTTEDVTDVEAHVAFMHIPIPRVGPGRFELVKDIPAVPRLFRRTYRVTFVAHSPDGSAQTIVGVAVR